MYCPNCAAQNETDMKFCRACGQDLSLISQAMTKSARMMVVNQVSKELKLYKELRHKPSFTRGAYFTVIGLFLFVFMSLLILSSGRISFSLAMLTMLALYFIGKGVRDLVKSKRAIALEARNNQKLTSAALPVAQPSAPPSVSESTTRPLELKNQTNNGK